MASAYVSTPHPASVSQPGKKKAHIMLNRTSGFVLALLLFCSVTSQAATPGEPNSPIEADGTLLVQQSQIHELDVTGKLRAASDGSGWEIVTPEDTTYHIQNPQQWSKEDWFDSNTSVRALGLLKPNTVKRTIVASQIMRAEEAKSSSGRVQDEIKRQIEKQGSSGKLQDLLKNIPFLKKLFD